MGNTDYIVIQDCYVLLTTFVGGMRLVFVQDGLRSGLSLFSAM